MSDDASRPKRPEFELPPYPHVPGRNARHNPSIFAAAKAAAPGQTRTISAKENLAWQFGLYLLDHGFYWECHEILETVWLNAAPQSAERAVLQGVIQLANAALKHNMGRPRAVSRIVDIAIGHFQRASGASLLNPMGVDLEAAIKIAEAVRQSADADYSRIIA